MEGKKRKIRKFYIKAVQHIYQRAQKGFLFAYTIRDHLVFSTIIFTVFRKYDIRPWGVCIMPEHLHFLARFIEKRMMSMAMDEIFCQITKEFNKYYGTKGSLFSRRYGNAGKFEDKKVRTAIAYLYNNPVEKKVAERCEDCRWTFLPYATSNHPFSDPLVLNQSSQRLRAAIKEVDTRFKSMTPIHYNVLERIFKNLSDKEKAQLADYIISTYNNIDFEEIIHYYGSYEAMILAINSNTGSEFDIREEKHPSPDTVYPRLYSILKERRLDNSFLRLDKEERQKLARELFLITGVPRYQIAKFLHLDSGDDF